jgi:hypothetical protein
MKDIKVGDIVKVYGHLSDECRPGMAPYMRGDKAEIINVTSEDEITIKCFDKPYTDEVHPKQCRMFKRRKPCKKCGK